MRHCRDAGDVCPGQRIRRDNWVKLSMNFLFRIAVIGVTGISLAACTNSARFSQSSPPPQSLAPVSSSTVQSQSLPPLDPNSPNGGNQNVLTTPDGQSQFPASDFESQDPLLGSAPQTSDGSIVALDAAGTPTATQSRDLTGPVTAQKLSGGWTIISGADQCRINLTQTSKPGTNRFRASAPNCTIPVLSQLASWQLAGTQVQLFSESGQLIGTLLQSGNRFIGSLSGGQGISMVG